MVSVVMPVFNGERYLQEALDSVLGQTWTDLELVVVDDGSTDGTAEILRRQSDDRVRVLSQRNTGIAGALNAGIKAARGRYVARMDADDRSLPDRLSRQLGRLELEPDLALLGASFYSISDDGHRLDLVPTLLADEELRRDLFVRCPFGHGTVVARRQVLLEVGGYDARAVPAEDYDLWSRVMAAHRVANLPEALYEYRVHPGNTPKSRGQLAAEAVRDRVWQTALLEPPSPPQVVSDVRRYLSTGDLGRSLASAYVRQHLSLLRECARRGRWSAVLRLAPVLLLCPLVVVPGLGRVMRRQLTPIVRKMAANRAR